MRTLITALVATTVLTVLTGIVYPLAVWGIARVVFPSQAGGSIVPIHQTLRACSIQGYRLLDQHGKTRTQRPLDGLLVIPRSVRHYDRTCVLGAPRPVG